MDPAKALLQVAPDLGESLTGAAQLYRQTQPQQITPYQQAEIDQRKAQTDIAQKRLDLEERKLNKPDDAFQAGPVQGQPVLDPTTKEPIPGLIATPSASGKSMTVHLTPKAEASLTPSTAGNLLEKLPSVDQAMGKDPTSKDSLTSTLGPDLVEAVKKAVPKKSKPSRVRVKSKDGKIGTIPSDQLDKALEQGFTEVK